MMVSGILQNAHCSFSDFPLIFKIPFPWLESEVFFPFPGIFLGENFITLRSSKYEHIIFFIFQPNLRRIRGDRPHCVICCWSDAGRSFSIIMMLWRLKNVIGQWWRLKCKNINRSITVGTYTGKKVAAVTSRML